MNPERLLQHADFLRSLARSLTRDEQLAEDAVQEAWLAGMRKPPREPGAGRAWLGTVVVNFMRNAARSARRRAKREERVAVPEASVDPDWLRAREETLSKVVQAVMALPDSYRTVVLLRYYDGLPPRKIAKRLGVPGETVRTRLKRAVKELRHSLDDASGGDRSRWFSALVPMARFSLGAGASSALAASTTGGLLAMKTTVKVSICALVCLTGYATWTLVGELEPSALPEREAVATPHAMKATKKAVPTEEADLAAPERRSVDAAPAPETRPPGIHGLVVDLYDRAVEGALVFLPRKKEQEPGDWFGNEDTFSWALSQLVPEAQRPGRKTYGWSAITDEKGRFAFEENTPDAGKLIVAWKDGLGTTFFRPQADARPPFRMALPDWPQIIGTVRDTRRTGLADATVWLSSRRSMPLPDVRTDEDGHFRLPPAREGEYLIRVEKDGYRSSYSEWLMMPDAGADRHVEITLERLPGIDFRLVDGEGLPWTGARFESFFGTSKPLRFWLSREVTKLPPDGESVYSPVPLMHDPDSGRVTGFVSDEKAVHLTIWSWAERFAVLEFSDPKVKTVVLRLPRDRASIEVLVRVDPGSSNASLEELDVEAGTCGGPTGTTFVGLSQEHGKGPVFRLQLPSYLAGVDCYVRIRGKGIAEYFRRVTLPLGAHPPPVFARLQVPGQAIRGRVVQADMSPIKRARVTVARENGDFLASNRASMASTDSEGRFSVEGLPTRGERLRVYVQAKGFASASFPVKGTKAIIAKLEIGRLLSIESRVRSKIWFCVKNHSGQILHDDRLRRATRNGSRLRIRVTPDAHEIWLRQAPSRRVLERGLIGQGDVVHLR